MAKLLLYVCVISCGCHRHVIPAVLHSSPLFQPSGCVLCVFKLWFSLTITIIVTQCPLSVHTLQPCGWIDGTFFIQTKNTWHVQWLSIAAQHVYTVKANLSDNNRNRRCSDSVIDQFIVDLMVFDVISVSTSQQGTAGYVKARGDIWRGRRGPGVLRQTHSSDWGQLMCPCAIFVSAAVIVIFYT